MRRSFCHPGFSGGLLVLLCLLTVGGCGRARRATLGLETDDPLYRRGLQLLKQGRNQEALGSFLQVIEKRGDRAPQSHLEAGLLYQEYFKDPIYAIYHFRKFLELEPDSRQAGLVRQRIDAAMRQFARSLPAQPLENETSRVDLLEKVDQLQKENRELRDRLARLDPGAVPPPLSANGAKPSPSPATLPLSLPPLDQSAGIPRAAAPSPARTATAGATGRVHVVAPGETLYGIAQRYYGNGSKWPEILNANRDQLKNENEVKPGMKLRIP